jgi:hypothetical protein
MWDIALVGSKARTRVSLRVFISEVSMMRLSSVIAESHPVIGTVASLQ